MKAKTPDEILAKYPLSPNSKLALMCRYDIAQVQKDAADAARFEALTEATLTLYAIYRKHLPTQKCNDVIKQIELQLLALRDNPAQKEGGKA